jgi:hypothetical protein
MTPEDYKALIHRRPWVNSSFLAPSLYDLVLAHFIALGSRGKEAEDFADAYFKGLREIL